MHETEETTTVMTLACVRKPECSWQASKPVAKTRIVLHVKRCLYTLYAKVRSALQRRHE